MTIQVRYFASLREKIGRDADELNATGPQTVEAVWQLATDGEAMPANLLMAVNQSYVKAGASVKDGDEVAFFPPVTGG